MLSGYPFRMVQQTQSSINSFIQLLGSLYQLPHPQQPDMPLAADKNLDITGFLYRSLEFLRKELSYSGSYKPNSTSDSPNELSAPTSYAPNVVSQYAMSQAQPSAASMAQAPQMPAYQAQAQAPQVSAPQANPWQQAFQALSASLNTSSQSQAQVSPSAYQTTPTPQAATQPSWASMAPSVPQTSQPQASTQSFSVSDVQALLQEQAQSLQASAPASAPDAYLNGISDASLEVLEHFGAEAPALLNQYACAVEDALIEQVQRANDTVHMLEAAGEERSAMNLMLTNPDVLADYVNEFFGPNGPYPTNTPEEQAAIDQEAARQQFELRSTLKSRTTFLRTSNVLNRTCLPLAVPLIKLVTSGVPSLR